MTQLRTINNKTTKNESVCIVPHLEIAEVVSVHFNVVNNDYQHDSRFLYTFFLNKLFRQLLNISPKRFIFLKTVNSEFSYLEVWFTNQSSKPQLMENEIFIYLFIYIFIYLFDLFIYLNLFIHFFSLIFLVLVFFIYRISPHV